jgi:hypothetical protein
MLLESALKIKTDKAGILMGKYTDEELRKFKKITLKIAGDYLGISQHAVGIGMRNNLLPIGLAIHNKEKDRRFSESWSYNIVAERLIAYNHGTISEVRVQNIENSLDNIVEEFSSLKQELLMSDCEK